MHHLGRTDDLIEVDESDNYTDNPGAIKFLLSFNNLLNCDKANNGPKFSTDTSNNSSINNDPDNPFNIPNLTNNL